MSREESTPGPRNPKVARFTIALAADMNARLERLADAAGANKGTMAALCIAAGINLLEHVYLRNMGVSEAEMESLTNAHAQRLASDVKRQAE